jgi:hypothetical protein
MLLDNEVLELAMDEDEPVDVTVDLLDDNSSDTV